jgi:uncharacterized protein YceK
MHSNTVLIAFAAIVTLATSGCGAVNSLVQSKVEEAKSTVGAVQSTAVPSAKATVAPQATKAAAASTAKPKATVTLAVATSSEDGNFSLNNIDSGLDTLKSYREHMVYTYEGKDDKGAVQKGGLDLLQEVVVATKDQHLKMTSTDAKGAGQSYETFQVGGSTYLFNNTGGADSTCTSFSSSTDLKTDPSSMFKPRDMLGNLSGAKLVMKGENVNGVATDHYAANDKDFGMGLYTSAKGDIWVAQNGGWVVKYTGEASGKSAFFGAGGSDGKISWEYSISDANKVDKIVVPPECEASKPADDIPIPDNVTEKGNLGSMITFKSPDDVAKLTDFYQTKLTAQGWKEGEGGMEGIMSFTKGNRTLNIMMSKEDTGGSSVVITDAQQK